MNGLFRISQRKDPGKHDKSLQIVNSTGRKVKNRCVRIAKVIKIIGKHCKVDFFNQSESGYWKKDGLGTDDVLMDAVIPIRPPINQPHQSNIPLGMYEFPKDIITVVTGYFQK